MKEIETADRTNGSARTEPGGDHRGRSLSRWALLAGVVASATSGAAGVALGYRYRADLRAVKLAILAHPLRPPLGLGDFCGDAAKIIDRHRSQTAETVTALKGRYENAVFGRMRVWDLVEKLALCIDPTDTRLYCASQFVHLQQILAGMERNGIEDPNMLVTAIIHDLGKVLLLTDEVPENVVCGTGRIGDFEEGIGLDSVVYQFGHGEFIYSRIKDHVPSHIAWVVRYHNIDIRDAAPYMDARERTYAEKYLTIFQRFDGGFVSPYFQPRIDLAKYRELIEEYFPRPILF